MQEPAALVSHRHRDPHRAFYTSDNRLVDYMVRLLDVFEGARCLEPAAGDGCFVHGVLRANPSVEIDAWELSDGSASALRDTFSTRDNVHVSVGNFLTDTRDPLFARTYDRVIANPPYGAWQDPTLRNELKRLFPGLYVKETYGLFLAKCFERLRAGGRLVFIVPETFLFIHRQQNLREQLLRAGSIVSVDIIPSSLFPGVNFGYARLSIVVVERRPAKLEHRFTVRHSSTMEELTGSSGRAFLVPQTSVLSRHSFAFPVDGVDSATEFIDSAAMRLGDIADCVTGFYSGCDGRFLRAWSATVKGAGRYQPLDPSLLYDGGATPPLEGIRSDRHFVPILKGGGHRYVKPPSWALDWSADAVTHYKSDSKARFQNSRFYFRRGIGLPMVSSTKANASLIHENTLFDQSIVGVFPRQPKHFWFLLVLLNSPTCFRLLRLLNPSANNSAKYVRQLPVVLPATEAQLAKINADAEAYVTRLVAGESRDTEIEEGFATVIAELYADPLGHRGADRVRDVGRDCAPPTVVNV